MWRQPRRDDELGLLSDDDDDLVEDSTALLLEILLIGYAAVPSALAMCDASLLKQHATYLAAQ